MVLAACGGAPAAEAPAPAGLSAHPLASAASGQVILAPINALRPSDPLGWTAQVPRSREYLQQADDAIGAELTARGLTQWVYPAALVRSARLSPTYAVDPYGLAAAPLRGRGVVAGTRIGDPLATQLRTMVALQETARFVVLPLELYFDRADATRGVAALRVALVDARAGEVRWIGDVRSDPAATFSRELLPSLAAHVADLFTAR
jgi:hypothetical protein